MKHVVDRIGRSWFVALACTAVVGCSTVGAVRSAEVRPGPSLELSLVAGAFQGDAETPFQRGGCDGACDDGIVGADLGIAFGFAPESGAAFSLGGGVSAAALPYVDGYVQLGRGDRPYGVGARVGFPVDGWSQHHLYGRYDHKLESGRRLLFNPTLLYVTGASPNGQVTGNFWALSQGFGYFTEGGWASTVQSISLGVAGGNFER